MVGPKPRGFWTAHGAGDYRGLRVGARYRVTRSFVDFDGGEHPIGEAWTFLGHAYLPYDRGLSLFVSLDGEGEWHIRMRDAPEDQGRIVGRLGDYLTESTG
jgi:hypothetical protein